MKLNVDGVARGKSGSAGIWEFYMIVEGNMKIFFSDPMEGENFNVAKCRQLGGCWNCGGMSVVGSRWWTRNHPMVLGGQVGGSHLLGG